MNTYSDNQTGHLYVLSNNASSPTVSDSMVVGNTVDHMFNIKFKHGGVVDEVSDNIDDRRILNIDVKAVKPVYFRKWEVKPITSNVSDTTTFSLYFYLENMTGFGLQDRWDIVSTYKAASGATPATVMNALKNDLAEKISAVGTTGANAKFNPIANDFVVTVASNMTGKEATALLNVTPSVVSTSWTEGTDSESSTKQDGTVSGKKYILVRHEGSNKVTYTYDNVPMNIDVTSNAIIVAENTVSPTYQHSDMEIMTNGATYEYDLTLSTYDGNSTWGGNARRIAAENTATVRFASGVVVKDMENFFMRNRKDLYSLSPNFNTSIINEGNADRTKYYSMVNVHYAYSDSLGFTYYSEKDLNIAVAEATEGATTNGTAFMNAILAKSYAPASVSTAISTLTTTINTTASDLDTLDARVTTLENA